MRFLHGTGTFTAGAWQTRDLNTEVSDTGNHCTLASNQFTLAAGTYRIRATAPAYYVNTHKLKLYNITDATDVLIGTSEYATASNVSATRSEVVGEFTIAVSKTFEVQHRGLATRATNGFGVASNFGVVEIYAQVELEKVG